MSDATIIPESGIWPEGIYCLQTTDKALGYNSTTEIDGPSNRQWIQFANRTRYLRELFTRSHTDDGHHELTDLDFADDAGITEEHIDIAYSTEDLKAAIADLEETVTAYLEKIDAGALEADELKYASVLSKVVPLSWEYGGNAYAFEMFTESMTMQTPSSAEVTRAVTGDDSLDVVSTSGLQAGQTYYLTDGTNFQFVTIKDILTEIRVRITEPAEFSISDEGWLRGTNVSQIVLATEADSDFHYISALLSNFIGHSTGTIVIRRYGADPEEKSVTLVGESGNEYEALFQYSRVRSSYTEDVYQLPELDEGFYLKVDYTGFTDTCTFVMFYIYTNIANNYIDVVHQPTIMAYEQQDDGSWLITGDYYGTLYGVPQASISAEVSPYYDFSEITSTYEVSEAIQEIAVDISQTSYVHIRYTDREGSESTWSEPVRIVIED